MANPDPATAAAERLQRVIGGENILDVYCPRKPGEQWTHLALQIANGLRADDAETLATAYAPLLQRLADVELLARAAKHITWTCDGDDQYAIVGNVIHECDFHNGLPILTPDLRAALESEVGK